MTALRFLFIPCILLITLSGVYRHDTRVEKYIALANQEEFNCAGRIYSMEDNTWGPNGSCVLIDSLHILTAAHCLAGEHKKDTVVDYMGYKVLTYVVTGKYQRPVNDFWFLVMNQPVKAKKITCYPDYFANMDSNHDLAIIELEKPVTNAQTIYINKSMDELSDTITGIGYGGSGPAIAADLGLNSNLRIAGQNIIDSLGGVKRNGIPTKLFADFDGPGNYAHVSKTGNSIALPLEYGTKGGDSGGPIFRMNNNRLELLGVLTGSSGAIPANFEQNGHYGQIDSWTRLSAYYDWIQKNL